jgi:hypothetical protein
VKYKTYPVKRLTKAYAKIWVIGTVVTLIVAWLLYRNGYEELAAAEVMISPFPFPGPAA